MLLLELLAASCVTFHPVQRQDFPRLPEAGIWLSGELIPAQKRDQCQIILYL